MTITIVHGGQTGVDRGGHEAARALGWKITGLMPHDGKDELGTIPSDVALWLTPCAKRGYAARTKENLLLSHALFVMVEDARVPEKTPGTKLTLELAHKWGMRVHIADARSLPGMTADWIGDLYTFHARAKREPFRLMVAGPREGKWAGAQAATEAYLRAAHKELKLIS